MKTNHPEPTEYSTWMTYEQAAARLGCSLKTIQRLVRSGQLTAHRRPGQQHRLIPLEQVKQLEAPAPIGEPEQ